MRLLVTALALWTASAAPTAAWDGMSDAGQPAASGVYFYQLSVRDFSQMKKMVFLK